MKDNKKLILVIIALVIIVIGAIVVGLKGFNVTLYLREHDTLEYIFDTKYEKSDIKTIAKEVFESKDFEIRSVEVFDDAVYIMAENITEDEEIALLEKLSALYSEDESEESEEAVTEETSEATIDESTDETATTEEVLDSDDETILEGETTEESDDSTESTILDELTEGTDYNLYHDSKIRLRDLLKPYIAPTVISAIIILICMIIRYRILKSEKVILKTIQVVGKSIILALLILSLIAIFRIKISAWIMPVVMFLVMIYLVITFECEIRRNDEKAN